MTTTMKRGGFWITGESVPGPFGNVQRGPMWVEWEKPTETRHETPIVLVHGGGGQGVDWLVTPDGRPGWAQLLVAHGWTVYVVDRPGHGRSPHHPDVLGPMMPALGDAALAPFFAPGPEVHPAAALHTQWPGGREAGDPVWEQWLASAGPMMLDGAEMQRLEQDRLARLLDRIGRAVLVTHSAGGPGTFLAADARPELVSALVAIETPGPPFADEPQRGAVLPWGVSAAPMTYDPPATDPAELRRGEEVRRLPNLAQIPIAVVTSESSPFLAFDREIAAYLTRSGCDADLVRLAEHGVHGNGHGMMFERNNAEVLAVITRWITRRAR